MIQLWRVKWHQPDMPFLIVQLPKFDIDAIEDGGWPLVREQEWNVANELENVATVVTLDAGEGNDLHPYDKKLVADRVFNAAMDLVYGARLSLNRPWQPSRSAEICCGCTVCGGVARTSGFDRRAAG